MLHGRVLLLNSDFSVLGTIGIPRAIRMTMRDEHPVQVLENVPDGFLNAGTDNPFPKPSVIRLIKYVPVIQNRRESGKKRTKIYIRDKFQCQYCSIKIGQPYVDPETKKKRPFTKDDLTLDHITPKSKGGSGHPTNLVAACKPCNSRKDNRNPEQARMPLRTEVKDVTNLGLDNVMLCQYVEHRPEWFPYLEGKDGFVEAYEQYLSMAA